MTPLFAAVFAINSVLGDASWIARYGEPPAGAPERARIEVHLEHVEALLRARDVSSLSERQRANRARALDLLTRYRENGLFPRRGDDGYPGRRPRFIDDRGVHCAVGYLVAATGYGAIAEDIDAREEYARVAEIHSPALVAWADAFGLSLRELAMIQPEYDAVPTADSTKREIGGAVDRITLECAREHPVVARVELAIRGTDRGDAVVTTSDRAPFAQCFARLASEIERGGGAYDEPIVPYETTMSVSIPRPSALLERRVSNVDLGYVQCWPRPGAIARTVSIAVEMGASGLSVDAQSHPSNAEIDACVEEHLRQAFHDFLPSIWRARATTERTIAPVMSSRRLNDILPAAVRSAAQGCHGEGEVIVVARASVDGPLSIEVQTGDDAFRACARERIEALLRPQLEVPRRREDGTYERYFRADAAAHATYRFTVR